MESKRGMSKWIWILIILVIIVLGIIIYFTMTGDTGGSFVGENSIPQPPALPE